MKIEIDDEMLGDFQPFAVLVFKPPQGLMVHLVNRPGDPRSLPEGVAAELVRAIMKPSLVVTLVKADGPKN